MYMQWSMNETWISVALSTFEFLAQATKLLLKNYQIATNSCIILLFESMPLIRTEQRGSKIAGFKTDNPEASKQVTYRS